MTFLTKTIREKLLRNGRIRQALEAEGRAETLVVKNGDLIRLAPGEAAVIDEVPAGRLHVDGDVLVAAESEALQDRRRLAAEGAITVSLAISEKRGAIVSGPDIRARGLPMASEEAFETALDMLAQAAEDAYLRLDARARGDDEAAEQAVIRAVRKASERVFKKRPLVDAIVLLV